ncbi:hypothetical protein [Halomonas smyrnensis]|uniref:hypothetical protein n=1 Tax=Halomonas smyrnensis TaxID=720605 RepID=UPI0012EACA20|nr:hypothetical protein [Halomonas smyrnensis]
MTFFTRQLPRASSLDIGLKRQYLYLLIPFFSRVTGASACGTARLDRSSPDRRTQKSGPTGPLEAGLVTPFERRCGYLLAAGPPGISAELTQVAMILLLKPHRGAVHTIKRHNMVMTPNERPRKRLD